MTKLYLLMVKYTLSLVIFMNMITGVIAQPQDKLSLSEAIETAKDRSLRQKTIESRYYSRFWRYRAASAIRFANISLNGSIPGLTRRINPITQPDGTILFLPQSQAFSTVSLVVEQPITPIGASIYVGSDLSRLDLFDQNLSYWSATPLFVGITVPLGSFNRRKWDWKQAKLQYQQSSGLYAEQMEELSVQVTEAYFDYYVAALEKQNAIQNKEVNDTIFKISQGRFNVGKIAENELLQVELNLMNATVAVSESDLRQEIAGERLKIIMGLGKSEQIVLDTLPGAPVIQVDVARAIQESKENSSRIVQNNIDLNSALIWMRENSRKRFIDGTISATFGLNQTDPNFTQVYSQPLNSQTATIDFRIPIYNFGKARADYKMAKAEYDATQAEIELAVMELEIAIKSLVLDMKRLESAVLIAQRSNDIAIRRFEVSKNRFLIGKIDITNLTIAQSEKDQALVTYVLTLRDYWRAYYSLRRATLYDFEKNEKLVAAPIKK